ncbi:MAG TPA: M28 family peptidase [Ignavibacteriales bacterium]|nr:M28 family peptidase [Ignavibacteriales bacterium]
MKIKLILLLNFLLAGILPAQDLWQGDPLVSVSNLKTDLKRLADDSLKGRATASPDEKRAAVYIAQQMKDLGAKPLLNDSYIQTFQLEAFVMNPESHLSFFSGGNVIGGLKIYDNYFFLKGYVKGKIDTTLDLVFAGYGFRQEEGINDYKDLEVKDKVVLVMGGVPVDPKARNMFSSKGVVTDMASKIRTAKRLGARGIIIVTDSANTADWDRMMLRGIRPQHRFPGSEKAGEFFAAVIRPEAFSTYIEPSLANMKVSVNSSLKTNLVKSYNAIGVIEGTDPVLKNEYVIVGAHHDHLGVIDGKIYNGADDNLSGVASVLETGRILKKLGENKRSVILISHGSEEALMLGSEFFVNHFDRIEDVSAMVNIDMVGRENRDTIYPIGSVKAGNEMKRILEETNNETVKFTLNYKFDNPHDPDRMYYRSDHYSYAQKGIPVVFFYDYMLKDYHKYTDDFEKIDFEKMAKIVELSYKMILKIANMDHKVESENP